MKNKEINELTNRLKSFSAARNWEQFHSPKNLVMALSGEVGELTEHFQWLTEEQSYLVNDPESLEEVKEELADVLLYLLQLSDKLGVDIIKSASKKIDANEKKYPVALSKGSATKYTKL